MMRRAALLLAGLAAVTAIAGCGDSTANSTTAAPSDSGSSSAAAADPTGKVTDQVCLDLMEDTIKASEAYAAELAATIVSGEEAAVTATKQFGEATATAARKQAAVAADQQLAKDFTKYAESLDAAVSKYTVDALRKDLDSDDGNFFVGVDDSLITKHCPDGLADGGSEGASPSPSS